MIDPIWPLKSLFYASILNHKLTAIVKARISSTDATSESKSITQLPVSALSPKQGSNTQLCRPDQELSFRWAGYDRHTYPMDLLRDEQS